MRSFFPADNSHSTRGCIGCDNNNNLLNCQRGICSFGSSHQVIVDPLSVNINSSTLLKSPQVGTFFPVNMCDPLCFRFLCEYQQLLEISLANHITVHVVGKLERQLSPLALRVNKKHEKDRSYHNFWLDSFTNVCTHKRIFKCTQN